MPENKRNLHYCIQSPVHSGFIYPFSIRWRTTTHILSTVYVHHTHMMRLRKMTAQVTILARSKCKLVKLA